MVTDNKIMTGKDYKLSRQAMRLLSEALARLRFDRFEIEHDRVLGLCKIVESLHDTALENATDEQVTKEWNEVSKLISDELFEDFYKFLDEGNKSRDKFRYWSIFLDIIMPVVIDLTHSFREGDWNLHLSAVH